MPQNVLSVKQLNLYVRSLLEGDHRLLNISIVGELSDFKNHYSSGHWYFTLKDNDALIRCVMFRGNTQRVGFAPENGQQVVLKGRVSLYEKDGQYQFYADDMTLSGIGDIAFQFEQIKKRLDAEGLFDPSSKRPLPRLPKNIAVITSPTGAAIQDILNILTRRWPISQIVLCPVSVQGESAVPEMLNALERVYTLGLADLIIIGRGGGSIEDLWAFNDETLARKIYESPVPVISAVGHETDFTICDFVADLRAPTPSAAAELAVPDRKDILATLDKNAVFLKKILISKYNLANSRLEASLSSSYFKNPKEAIIYQRQIQLDKLCEQLNKLTANSYSSAQMRFCTLAAKLDALSPLKVLSRGFAALQKDEKTVCSANDISVGDDLTLKLKDGCAKCSVTEIFMEDENVRKYN